MVALRHGDDDGILHQAARLAHGLRTVAQRRSGRTNVVEQRNPPSSDSRGITGKSAAGGQPLHARASPLGVAQSLFEGRHDARARYLCGPLSNQRNTVETANAPASGSRWDWDQQRSGLDERRHDVPERLRDVSSAIFEREHRRAQRTFICTEGSDTKRRKGDVNRLTTRRTGSAKTGAQRVAACALRRKEQIEQRHGVRSRQPRLLTRDLRFIVARDQRIGENAFGLYDALRPHDRVAQVCSRADGCALPTDRALETCAALHLHAIV